MINGRDGVINIEAATRLVEDQRIDYIDYETRGRLDPGTILLMGLVHVSCRPHTTAMGKKKRVFKLR